MISLPHSIAGEIETTLIDLGAGHPSEYDERKDEIEGNIVKQATSRSFEDAQV